MERGIQVRGQETTEQANSNNSQTGNNNYTTDMQSTINQMIERFVPEDSDDGEDAHHKHVRQQASTPLQTNNDVEFTRHEVQAILEKFDPVKRPVQ